MRWSCPHCGTNLTVADEKIGSGWSFSRCYKCAGFALVRKAEINLIKVHGAPAGEKVIPTESHEQQFLSQQAIQNYNRLVNSSASVQPQHAQPMPVQGIPAEFFQLPEPLPEPSSRNLTISLPKLPTLQGKVLPLAIAAAGVTAVLSGIYFYVQGQALLSRARVQQQPQTVAQTPQAGPKTQAIQAAAAQISAPPQQAHINDQVRERIMAPARQAPPRIEEPVEWDEDDGEELTAVTPQISSMAVRVPIDKAKIRSGPGLDYPVIAYARPDQRYLITSWNERWFKIKVQTAAAASMAGTTTEGWIRNDLVQMIHQ